MMMPKTARVPALLALTLATIGGHAGAQPVAPPLTPAQAASLDRALQLWTGATTPYTITPEADHYHLDKQPNVQSALTAAQVVGGHLTASVRPLDRDRWRFDDVRAGTPILMSVPAMRGQPASQTTIDLQSQNGHAVIDPSLATPSTMDGSASSATGTFNSPPALAGSFRVGPITTHGLWQPAGPGRIDRSSAVALGDLAIQTTGKQTVSMTAAAFHGQVALKGFAPDRSQEISTFLRANLPTLSAASAPVTGANRPAAGLTPAERKCMHHMLDTVRQVATSSDADGTFDDVAFASGGRAVKLRELSVAQSLAAPNGRLALGYRITLDGLSIPDLPPAMRDLVPHHVLASPRISGLSVEAVFAAMSEVIDSGVVDDRKPDAMRLRQAAILKESPLSIGLDALAFDVGPATVAGTGAIRIAGFRPQDFTATTTLEVKRLDALLHRANANPALSAAAPVLIFLKGIGETSGDSTVWKIVYSAGRVLVNGNDLSGMLPHNR